MKPFARLFRWAETRLESLGHDVVSRAEDAGTGVDAKAVEAQFVEQEHRRVRIILNFLATRSLAADDPRRPAAVRALVWSLFGGTGAAVVTGGLIALLTLAVMVWQTRKMQEQTRQMQAQTTLIAQQNDYFREQNAKLQEQIDAQTTQARSQRRTEIIAALYDTIEDSDGKLRPRASARTRGEAVREFVSLERAAKHPQGAPDFIVDLRGAYLEGVKVAYLDFSDAGFDGATLDRADFYFCSFKSAVMRETAGREVKFFDCTLEGANCERVAWPGAQLTHTSMEGAKFKDADLQEASFKGVSFKRADFTSADLRKSVFVTVRDWQDAASFEATAIKGIARAPEGFLDWAKKKGATDDPNSFSIKSAEQNLE